MDYKEKSIIKKWWRGKQLNYNIGLIVSCLAALLVFSTIGGIISFNNDDRPENLIMLAMITTRMLSGLFIVGMLLANILFSFLSLIDLKFNKNDTQSSRIRLFRIFYWVSFVLPVIIIFSFMLYFIQSLKQP